MKIIELTKVEHNVKIGQECGPKEPNVTEDCFLTENGIIVGFFLRDISKHSKKLSDYIAIANNEFNSKNVPKSKMARAGKLRALQMGMSKEEAQKIDVEQMSCIIGSIPPKALMRREYPTRSSVHSDPKAKTFIKAMLLACRESESIIKKYAPEIYEQQVKLIEENVPEKWRFSKLFTSSISNYNISAPFHRDAGNVQGCVNVIITKKEHAVGGNLHVPDYNATFDSRENSMLVYPAWKNVHGVTPIEAKIKGGYRNSLVFYPLKAFKKY